MAILAAILNLSMKNPHPDLTTGSESLPIVTSSTYDHQTFSVEGWNEAKIADYKKKHEKLPRRQMVDHTLHSIDCRRLRTSPVLIMR